MTDTVYFDVRFRTQTLILGVLSCSRVEHILNMALDQSNFKKKLQRRFLHLAVAPYGPMLDDRLPVSSLPKNRRLFVREVCPLKCHICVCFTASHGRSGKVHADPSTCTVHELSTTIARQLHLPPTSAILHWPCGGGRILDSAAPRFTLARAGFPTSGSIQLDVHLKCVSAPAPHTGAVQIFIKYKKSHTISIVPSVDTVHTLQTKIWNKVGIPVGQQWLQCRKPLPYNDSTPLSEYGIVGGMTIFLNLRPTNCFGRMHVESPDIKKIPIATGYKTIKRGWQTSSVQDASDMPRSKRVKSRCGISKSPAVSMPMSGQLLRQHFLSRPASSSGRPSKRSYNRFNSRKANPFALSIDDCSPMKRFKRETITDFLISKTYI